MNRLATHLVRAAIAASTLVVAAGTTTTAVAREDVGTQFTYQGRLTRTGSVVGVPADFRFRLYDAATDGNQVGPEIAATTTPVGGLFTVALDFGVNPYTSNDALWLEIDVAAPTGSAFETLTPRQRLTAAPFSLNTRGIDVDASNNLTMFGDVLFPQDVVIGGPQANNMSTDLTIQAGGNVSSNEFGGEGGQLTLRAGNANTACAQLPTPGTSFNNNVHIIAGDNTWLDFTCGRFFNGNIQFFAGDAESNGGVQPERMRIVGDNGFVGIGNTDPVYRLDVSGRSRVRGSAAVNDTAGIWYAQPVNNVLTDLAFAGMENNNNFGVFLNGIWRFTVSDTGLTNVRGVLDVDNDVVVDGNDILLTQSAVIGGRQINAQGTNLTVQAGGNVSSSGGGGPGGQLVLRAGNCNSSAANLPPLGTSNNNDVIIQAGDNTFDSFAGEFFNGNVRFFAGDGLPERMRLVGDNGQLLIGTTTASNFRLDVAGSIRCVSLTQTSAREFKQNITDLTGALESIMKLNAVQYDWNELAPEQVQGKHDIGFLADEVNEVLPDIVAKDDSGKPIGIDYTKITPVAVEAIKQLKGENDDLKSRLAALEALVAKLARQNN